SRMCGNHWCLYSPGNQVKERVSRMSFIPETAYLYRGEMRKSMIIITGIIAALAVAAIYLAINNWWGWWGYGPMMGWGYFGAPAHPPYMGAPYGVGNAPYGMMGWGTYGYPISGAAGYGYPSAYSLREYTINESMQLMSLEPSNAKIFRGNDTIVFYSDNVTLIVIAMMGNDAEKMTGTTAPAYSHGDVFVIYGLINPTIIVPADAVLHVVFINLDDDMYHNFIITEAPPPYPFNVMPYAMRGTEMGPAMMAAASWLPPANYGEGYAYGYAYSVVLGYPGVYWYICTYPGHAEEGMYGEIVVNAIGGR
ncbi:MAG: plastocyanin/azurin family copper-binding protein, partial [Thermocladium sp.]